jgi:hypothetical protein
MTDNLIEAGRYLMCNHIVYFSLIDATRLLKPHI